MVTAPSPPYWAVVLSSALPQVSLGDSMLRLAQGQPGYLGAEPGRQAQGRRSVVSYWGSVDAIAAWRNRAEQLACQRLGPGGWSGAFSLQVLPAAAPAAAKASA